MPYPPPSTSRVIFLLAGTGLRRWANRFSALSRPKKKPPPGLRAATPRKGARNWVLAAVMVPLFLFNSAMLASQFLTKLAAHFGGSEQTIPLKDIVGDDGKPMKHVFIKRAEFKPEVVPVIGLLLLIIGLGQFLMGLGTGNQDLGKVEWSMEWLFTLPASAGTLFLAKVFEFTLMNAYNWFITFPLMLIYFGSAGFGVGALPASAAATIYSGALIASLRVAAETGLRKSLPLNRLKNFQAVFTLSGTLLLFMVFGVALSPHVPAGLIDALSEVPRAILWNPFSLPALVARGDALPWGGMILCVILFPLLAVRISRRLVRDGLVVMAGPYAGTRSTPGAAGTGREQRLGGVAGKELRLLLRDRNLMVQTLLVPLLMFAFNLFLYPSLLRGAADDFRHAATLAFGMGAYVLMFSAFHILTVEGGALWILYTFPRDLHRILFQKTLLWCAISLAYTALALIVIAVMHPATLPASALFPALSAAIGVVLFSFIAGSLGVLGTDPLETEVQRRVRPEILYLYMFLAGVYGFGLYNPSFWVRGVQIVLFSALALATWQKVRERIPFLLDPTQAPPPRITLSDGLVAALTFFLLQDLTHQLLQRAAVTEGIRVVAAFLTAGLFTGIFSLYIFWRLKVPDLLATVGLRRKEDDSGPSVFRSISAGVLAGTAAAGFGLAYLTLIDRVGFLRSLKEESLRLGMGPPNIGLKWITVLAVVAAPLFEEYIFRGLVYRGLRRFKTPLFAIPASAALFAIVHPPISSIPVFVMGVAAAAAFERTRLLAAPIAAHMMYNALMIALQWGR